MRYLFSFAIFCFYLGLVNATCTYITQQSGQYCADLATACKITLTQLYSYNPTLGSSCQGLIAGQKVCCTSGGLAPPANSNGTCATYTVIQNDSCNSIGANNGLTNAQLESFNKQTWGWLGCADLQLGANICLSTGTPPVPTPNPLSTCGMTAPGKLFNSSCPLNACCSQFGFCGVTSEFCATTTSTTNSPGTVGCQSNCQMDYKTTSGPPSEFIKIGYWEEFQWQRPCMNLDAIGLQNIINTNNYTEIHYSFAVISDYEVSIQNMTTFNDFLTITGVKKVITFGGWAFSTDSDTIHIFGEAAQQQTFVNSVVSFVNQYNLDGIEIDWEYPGATDLYGWAGSTPTEFPDDGTNYLSMLEKMRTGLPSGKSLSIAAPSSFWYLQNFPIANMSKYVDYIMMMTYDLHGQWDYNINSTGPYLLSHVNQTETIQALTMITKAGVPSNKIVMGVGSYARSFQQTNPSCYGPTCTFTGPASGATPGNCTNTAGYIGFGELQQIVDTGVVRKMYYDEVSGSDILLYNIADWAAYTNITTTLPQRYTLAQGMNLLGTGEWAVDLRGSVDDEENNMIIYNGFYNISVEECPTTINSFSDAQTIASQCGYQAAAAVLISSAQNALNDYNSIMAGPDCSSACTYDEEDDYCQQQCASTNPNFEQLYKLYAGAAEAAAYRNIDAYFSSAIYQTDGTWSTPWNRYTSCSGIVCAVGESFTVTDWDGMIKDLDTYANNSYIFNSGSYVFPIEFEHPDDKNCYTYTNFPALNTSASFPDPSTFISSDIGPIENSIRLLNAALNDNSTTDAQFKAAVTGATYIILPFMRAVDTMPQIVNIGNQALQAQQEQAQNEFLSILEIIGLIAVSFIPDIGPELSAAIGVAIAAAGGDTNPLDYIASLAGAAGAIGDIGKLVDDTAESLEAAASKVENILSDDPKTFSYLDDYKPYNDFESVVEEADSADLSAEEGALSCS